MNWWGDVPFFANRGEFCSGEADEIMNKAGCLSLQPNAVPAWNTRTIFGLVNQLQTGGYAMADQNSHECCRSCMAM